MAADTVALVVSILCVVISSLTTTFGLFFQKIAQQRTLAYKNAVEGSHVIPNPKTFRRWTCAIWFAGFLCITIFSFALDLYSMATLGQSLVVPLLACLEVAENQIFAPAVLGERFDKCRDTTASAVVIMGALCTTFFGPGGPFGGSAGDPTPDMDNPEMKEYFAGLFLAPVFIGFEGATVGLLIVCLILSRCNCCKKLHFLMLGYVAGFLGGQQNMFLKGVGMSFSTGFGGDPSVFADWMVYVFAFFMAALASLQLFFLNVGLAKFQALLFVPTYTILYIVSGTAVGLVFYQEYKLMSDMGWLMFGIGFFFIVAAMLILGSKKQSSTEDKIMTFDECNIEVIGHPEEMPPTPGSMSTGGCCVEDTSSTGTSSEHPALPCGSHSDCVHPFPAPATPQTVNGSLSGSLNGSLNGTLRREAWAAPDTPNSLPPRPGTAPPEGANSKASYAQTDPPRPSTALGAGDSKAAPRRGSIAPMPERALALMRARAAGTDPSPASSPVHVGASFSGVALAVAAANGLRGATLTQADMLAPPTLPALPSTLGRTAEEPVAPFRLSKVSEDSDPAAGRRPIRLVSLS